VRLAGAGVIRFAELDTSNLKGNAPGWASLRGCDASTSDADDPASWFDLLPRTRLQPDTRHRFALPEAAKASEVTDVRLDIYPDGGMARLRLFGALTPLGQKTLTSRFNTTTL
jgi:allantoicase